MQNQPDKKPGKTGRESFAESLADWQAKMDAEHAGKTCAHCGEEILPGEAGEVTGAHLHRECLFRTIAGSVGHLEGRCSCHGGTASDPEGLTPRQAANAALALWRQLNAAQVKWPILPPPGRCKP